MSNFLVAFLVGISAATWMYARTMKTTGNNNQSSLIAGGVIGGLAFVVFFALAAKFLNT